MTLVDLPYKEALVEIRKMLMDLIQKQKPSAKLPRAMGRVTLMQLQKLRAVIDEDPAVFPSWAPLVENLNLIMNSLSLL